MINRLIGGLIAIIGAVVISKISLVPLENIFAVIAFVLSVDSVINRYITYLYMKEILETMEEAEKNNNR